MITKPTAAWKSIGRKMKAHSIGTKSGPSEWIMSTRDWKVRPSSPARMDALVRRWTARNAPTGTKPASENSR